MDKQKVNGLKFREVMIEKNNPFILNVKASHKPTIPYTQISLEKFEKKNLFRKNPSTNPWNYCSPMVK